MYRFPSKVKDSLLPCRSSAGALSLASCAEPTTERVAAGVKFEELNRELWKLTTCGWPLLFFSVFSIINLSATTNTRWSINLQLTWRNGKKKGQWKCDQVGEGRKETKSL